MYIYIYIFQRAQHLLACVDVSVCVCSCVFMAVAGKMSVYVTGEIYVLPINVSSCELQHTHTGMMWHGMEGRWGRGKVVENCVGCHFSACIYITN